MIVPKADLHQLRETDPRLVSMDINYKLTNQLTDLTELNWLLKGLKFEKED